MKIESVWQNLGRRVRTFSSALANPSMELDRREFLQASAIGSVALATVPSLLSIQEPSKVEPKDENQEKVSFESRLDLKLRELTELSKDKKELEKSIKELNNIGTEDNNKFSEWINKKVNENPDQENLEKRNEILEKVIRSLVLDHNDYFNYLSMESRINILSDFIPAYKKIIEQSRTNPDILFSSLITFSEMKDMCTTGLKQEKPAEYEKAMNVLLPLYEEIIKNVCNPSNAKERKFLLRQFFAGLQMFVNDNIPIQDKLVDIISNHFFKDGQEGLLEFVNSVPSNDDISNPQTSLNPYFVLKLVNHNGEYFAKYVKKTINDSNQATNPADQTAKISELTSIFSFFATLPKLNSPKLSKDEEPDCDCLRWEVSNLAEEQIQKPIANFYLHRLQNESTSIKVKMTPNGEEREIKRKSWEDLNKNIALVAQLNSSLFNGFPPVISNRLNNDTNPYDKEMAYHSIGSLVGSTPQLQSNLTHFQMLREKFTKEDLLQGLRGIGSTIAQLAVNEKRHEEAQCSKHSFGGTKYESMTFYNFFVELDKIVKGNFERKKLISVFIPTPGKSLTGCITIPINIATRSDALLEFQSKKLTPAQTFIVDLVRLVGWDFDYYKKLLPECTFETERKEDFIKAAKLRHRALLTLAYCISSLPDYEFAKNNYFRRRIHTLPAQEMDVVTNFKKIFINILEENLGAYSLPEKWGEEVAALLEVCRNYDEGGSAYIRDKEAYLHEHYFGDNGLFNRLTPKEKIKEAREEFARTFLDSAPSECFVSYRNCLGKLGYRFNEIDLQANNLLALARN